MVLGGFSTRSSTARFSRATARRPTRPAAPHTNWGPQSTSRSLTCAGSSTRSAGSTAGQRSTARVSGGTWATSAADKGSSCGTALLRLDQDLDRLAVGHRAMPSARSAPASWASRGWALACCSARASRAVRGRRSARRPRSRVEARRRACGNRRGCNLGAVWGQPRGP